MVSLNDDEIVCASSRLRQLNKRPGAIVHDYLRAALMPDPRSCFNHRPMFCSFKARCKPLRLGCSTNTHRLSERLQWSLTRQ